MPKTLVNIQELIVTLDAHKANHLAQFAIILNGYNAEVQQIVQNNLSLAQSANLEQNAQISKIPPEPQEYSEEYDKLKGYLESFSGEAELENALIDSVNNDLWRWKREFTALLNKYS